jgi:AAA15 family ATPase/GTPase
MHFKHFFSGRNFPENDDCPIIIGEIDNNALHISHVLVAQYEEEKTTADGSIERSKKTKILNKPTHTLVDGSPIDGENVDILQAIFCKKNEDTLYKIVQGDYRHRGNIFRSSLAKPSKTNNIDEINCAYIPTTIPENLIDKLGHVWDKIALTDKREHVHQALKIIYENFEELTFIANLNPTSPLYRAKERLVIIKIKEQSTPIPLNSMGDGMLCILSLILNLISAKDGFLLIDEFENGFHYSIQPKVWALIFKLAKDFNIQVFATTHSKDCVESFSEEVLKNDEIEGVLIRMSRSVAKNNLNAVIAIEYSEESMTTASYQNMEVR